LIYMLPYKYDLRPVFITGLLTHKSVLASAMTLTLAKNSGI